MILMYILLLIMNSFCEATSEELSVIIIGAGSAGIAAATRLLKNNITNIRILEGEDRIGGRIYTKKFGDAFVDIGAEWVHGTAGNIVYELVKDYGILQSGNLSSRVIYSNGQIIDEELTNNIFDLLINYRQSNEIDEGISVGEQVLSLYNSRILEKYENDPNKLDIAMSGIDFLEHRFLSFDSAFSWFQIAFNDAFENIKGDRELNWNGLGYKKILDILMQKYPNSSASLPIDDKILLSKEVTSISWKTETTKVTIECVDKSSYEADHVIFTPSLGVLKTSHNTLFKPILPSIKQNALDALGFGAIAKIILYFPQPWWKEEDYNFFFMWSYEDKARLAMDFKNGTSKDGISWIYYLNYVFQAENNPKVLIVWVSGAMVPEIENISDLEIIDGCMYTFHRFLGDQYNITRPQKMLRSLWYGNHYFRGTYSFDTPKAIHTRENLHDVLAQPLMRDDGSPSICFAGEATHSNYYSTVHGAIETGYREADRIINLKKYKN